MKFLRELFIYHLDVDGVIPGCLIGIAEARKIERI